MQERLPSPSDPATFEASKLERRGDPRHAPVLQLHRDLLTLRRADPVLAELGTGAVCVETSALTDDVLIVRYQRQDGLPRLLVVNFGTDLVLPLMNDPLLAAPAGQGWHAVVVLGRSGLRWDGRRALRGRTSLAHPRPVRHVLRGQAMSAPVGPTAPVRGRTEGKIAGKCPRFSLVKRWSRHVHRTRRDL
jgi:hypothetical protein